MTRRRSWSTGGRKFGPLNSEMLRTSYSSRSSARCVLGGGLERSLDQPPARDRRERLAGAGHDHRQRGDALRVAAREHLGDHPAHRRADHVCLVDLEVVQQLCDIVGEVDERVRHRAGPPEQVARDAPVDRAFGAHPAHLGRQPGVAVVEPDHPVAVFDQPFAEAVGPHRQLGADAHDQHHGRVVEVAEVLVEQLASSPQAARPLRVGMTFSTASSGRVGSGRRPCGFEGPLGAIWRASSASRSRSPAIPPAPPSTRTSLRRRWTRG